MTDLRTLGTAADPALLGELAPENVLDELNKPMLFTSRFPQSSRLALVCWIDEDNEGDVRLVVPTQDATVRKIVRGELTIREALEQPWAWLSFSEQARAIQVEELPADCLPQRGVYLQRDFAPLLSVRFTGDIDENNVTASVIGRATDAVRGALKPLLDYVTEADVEGRPTNALRRLYDLPARRMAYGSFEVDFGSPTQLDLLGDERRLLGQASELLQKGLKWATSGSDVEPPEENAEWGAILAALKHLVPPGTGRVQNVELDGKLTSRRVSLNRHATRNVIRAIKARGSLKAVARAGYVREFDRDKLTFILREEPYAGATEHRCVCDETLADDVDWAFATEHAVTAIGHAEKAVIRVLSLDPVPSTDSSSK